MASRFYDLRFILFSAFVLVSVQVPHFIGKLGRISGYLFSNGKPVGEDFLNLWSTARLLLEGKPEVIYRSAEFLAYEYQLVGQDIGFRLWVYPIHSLLLVWPFGLVGYYTSLLVWSLLGLVALVVGCKAIGLRPLETTIVLFSPATYACLYCGQTGNLATGLLLIALSNWPKTSTVLSAAVLTIKPQMGFLLPFIWIKEGRWSEIIWTSVVTLALVVGATAYFGLDILRDYIWDTLHALSAFEKTGTGPFLYMIPSVFMSARLLGLEGDTALVIHVAFAVPMVCIVLIKLFRTEDRLRRVAIVLSGMALVTPYMHNYDFNIITVAALLVFRRRFETSVRADVVLAVVTFSVGLAVLVQVLGFYGVPIAPLIILALFLLT